MDKPKAASQNFLCIKLSINKLFINLRWSEMMGEIWGAGEGMEEEERLLVSVFRENID